MVEPGAATVFLYALATAVATALGAIPFVFVPRVSARAVAYANAVASGLMLGACFGLVAEGAAAGAPQTGVGALLGVLFILATQRAMRGRQISVRDVRPEHARKMVLIVLVMTVHSAAEGIAVGASFAGSAALAGLITAAIAVHNIPEGMAISAVLRPRGASIGACAGWSLFSSLPQPLVAVPTFLFVERVRPALPYGIGFAAGAMVFMVLQELLPEAYGEGRRAAVGAVASVSLVAMVVLQQYL